MLVALVIIPTAAMPSSSEGEGLAAVAHLRNVVEDSTACALPGVGVKYDTFIPCMWKAVARVCLQRGVCSYKNVEALGRAPSQAVLSSDLAHAITG